LVLAQYGVTPGLHPTIRQIAAAAQVSATTVSMALRNHPRIPPATRLRIQTLARRMNYRPNPAIVSLMTEVRSRSPVGYHETLGWINPHDRADHFVNKRLLGLEYHQNLWAGALHRAGQLGYALESFWLRAPKMSAQRMSAILVARGIRGLLLPPLPGPNGHLSLDWSHFSVTALSYTIVRPQFHRVVPDHHHNIRLILRTLQHRRYERIGMFLPARFDERLEDRFRSAFYFYHQTIPVGNRLPVLIGPDKNYESIGAAWLKKWRPDAVITLGTFRDLREIDIGDPAYSQKLGIVLMGCGAVRDRSFTVVDENPFRIGESAVDRLAGQLQRNEPGIPDNPETTLIKGTWIDGQTIKPRQPTARETAPAASA